MSSSGPAGKSQEATPAEREVPRPLSESMISCAGDQAQEQGMDATLQAELTPRPQSETDSNLLPEAIQVLQAAAGNAIREIWRLELAPQLEAFRKQVSQNSQEATEWKAPLPGTDQSDDRGVGNRELGVAPRGGQGPEATSASSGSPNAGPVPSRTWGTEPRHSVKRECVYECIPGQEPNKSVSWKRESGACDRVAVMPMHARPALVGNNPVSALTGSMPTGTPETIRSVSRMPGLAQEQGHRESIKPDSYVHGSIPTGSWEATSLPSHMTGQIPTKKHAESTRIDSHRPASIPGARGEATGLHSRAPGWIPERDWEPTDPNAHAPGPIPVERREAAKSDSRGPMPIPGGQRGTTEFAPHLPLAFPSQTWEATRPGSRRSWSIPRNRGEAARLDSHMPGSIPGTHWRVSNPDSRLPGSVPGQPGETRKTDSHALGPNTAHELETRQPVSEPLRQDKERRRTAAGSPPHPRELETGMGRESIEPASRWAGIEPQARWAASPPDPRTPDPRWGPGKRLERQAEELWIQ